MSRFSFLDVVPHIVGIGVIVMVYSAIMPTISQSEASKPFVPLLNILTYTLIGISGIILVKKVFMSGINYSIFNTAFRFDMKEKNLYKIFKTWYLSKKEQHESK